MALCTFPVMMEFRTSAVEFRFVFVLRVVALEVDIHCGWGVGEIVPGVGGSASCGVGT